MSDTDAVTIIARMLIENRDRADRLVRDRTAAARARGATHDAGITYAEGTAHAFALACSIVAGAFGVPDIDLLAGEWTPPRDALPPMLPDADPASISPDVTNTAPGDRIAIATVIHDRSASDE